MYDDTYLLFYLIFIYVEHPNPHDCLSGQGQGFHSQNIHFLSHTFVFIFIRYSHLLTVLLVISSMLSTQTHTTVCGAKARDFTARIFTHFLSHICFHFHKFQYICRSAKCVNERERERNILTR
jgi:hypothetical protein